MLFAEDTIVIANSAEEANRMLERVREALEGKGLRVNRDKTECMECKWDEKKGTVGEVKIEGQSIKKVREYRYLGALMQEDREIDKEVGARVQAEWMKCREGKGMLCDKRVPLKVKGKFYATVVRLAMTYVSKCW